MALLALLAALAAPASAASAIASAADYAVAPGIVFAIMLVGSRRWLGLLPPATATVLVPPATAAATVLVTIAIAATVLVAVSAGRCPHPGGTTGLLWSLRPGRSPERLSERVCVGLCFRCSCNPRDWLTPTTGTPLATVGGAGGWRLRRLWRQWVGGWRTGGWLLPLRRLWRQWVGRPAIGGHNHVLESAGCVSCVSALSLSVMLLVSVA